MNNTPILNLFYEEPDPDRWFKYDRYLRKFIRRIVRGKPLVGGQKMVALELMKGLDKLGISYRFNDFNYAKRNPNELIGVIGKPFILKKRAFKNPILFGASVFSHPLDYPTLLSDFPNIKKILVPGDWMKDMFTPYFGNIVQSWPVGIDTEKWHPSIKKEEEYNFLIYDKLRWNRAELGNTLIESIKKELDARNLTYTLIKYGSYKPQELKEKIEVCKAAIFLCEHETQGIAYQQILATGTPMLAYDQQGLWKDPQYYPEIVKYGPVSSVPYWDSNCGEKFEDEIDFSKKLNLFLSKLESYEPRNYILNNLTHEISTNNYLNIYRNLETK